MSYNKKKHLKLLKRSENLTNLGKSLYKESEQEYLKLMEYEADIESYLYWNKRTRFLLLMEQFVNRIITGEEFRDELWGSRRQLTFECNDFLKELYSETEKDFEVDPRSYKFGSFISLLICECENFTDDYENEEFYDSIKYWFLKLQKALKEE